MIEPTQLTESVLRLKSSMERDDYKGFDPYDGLLSPVFRLPILRSNHTVRFLAQQAIKRAPINLRPLLGIPKGVNPVTLGLVVLAHVHLKRAGVLYDYTQTQELIGRLFDSRSKGYPYTCWGYDFPWAAKHADIPTYGPTVVATGIITNALFHYWKETACTQSARMICDACDFVTKALNRSRVESGGFIFSYSPFDHEAVLNASMKGVRLLSQGVVVSNNRNHLEIAQAAIQPVLSVQRQDGSWPYSMRSKGQWTDNYHTGYVLDSLDEYIQNTGDATPKSNLQRGLSFYLSNFIGENGRPFLYSNPSERRGPVDCTAGGQTLLTLARFNEVGKARLVAEWMIANMQDKKGYFHYRKYKWIASRTEFMRWSNAWMLAGISSLLDAEKKTGGTL